MKNERTFDLIAWAFIFIAGLLAAYVTFGVLKSQADGQFEGYSVGGAIAGALVSWSLLTTLYLQIRGSSNELRDLRNRTEELQHKLIRGAPRPEGFEIEVEERQRIVLARPRDWQPKGGTIFDLELRDDKLKETDSFAAAFRCYFFPIEDKKTPERGKYYQNEITMYNDSDYVHSFSHEFIQLGGDVGGVECLKIISRQFAKITEVKSKETGRTDRSWYNVRKGDAVGNIIRINPPKLIEGQQGYLEIVGYGLREGATVYVNGIKRDIVRIDHKYSDSAFITLIPSDTDYINNYARQVSISFENKDIGGLRTNEFIVIVEAQTQDSQNANTGIVLPEIKKENEAVTTSTAESEKVITQEVQNMRVVCYNQQLSKIYYFDFVDDANDFKDSSALFNRVLNSVRFLD